MKTIDNPASVRSASPEMVFAWLKEQRARPSLRVTLGGSFLFPVFPPRYFPWQLPALPSVPRCSRKTSEGNF